MNKIDLSLVTFEDLWNEICERVDTAICATVGHDGDENNVSFKFFGKTFDGLALSVLLQRYIEAYSFKDAKNNQEGELSPSDEDVTSDDL